MENIFLYIAAFLIILSVYELGKNVGLRKGIDINYKATKRLGQLEILMNISQIGAEINIEESEKFYNEIFEYCGNKIEELWKEQLEEEENAG